MKNQVLKLIKEKKSLFQKDLVGFLSELEKFREGPKMPTPEPGKVDKDIFKKMAKFHDDYNNLKNKIFSGKIIIQALSELELEIERINENEFDGTSEKTKKTLG